MRIEGSSIPFHMAQAYGVSPSGRAAPISPPAPALQLGAEARKLVAGAVPGKINFGDAGPLPSAGLPMYRHPADKNAAATGIGAGRVVDLTA